MANPRVFTIPASAPFVPTLIRALIDGTLVPGFPAGHDPLALAGATLYLPTRRGRRVGRGVFLPVTRAPAADLPPLLPPRGGAEGEIAFPPAARGGVAGTGAHLPPASGGARGP